MVQNHENSAKIPDAFLDLFKRKSFGHLATMMDDGTPQVTPVWVDYEDQCLLINSARNRIKDVNMRNRPHVALSIQDPENPYRFLAVRGKVVDIIQGEKAESHIDRLAQRYLGKEKYPQSMRYPGEVRVLYKVRPHHVLGFDPFAKK
ncbi:MAG: PPOX class F420-dependent oxidoreductase [Acidobacteria bacterium]|nr:PPOX class F420-dependent oxidoreductase [Acidobacteriota bacterium]